MGIPIPYFAVVLASSAPDFSLQHDQHNTCTILSWVQHALVNKNAPEVCSMSWLPLGAWALSVGDDCIHWHPNAVYTRRHLSTPADPIASQIVRIFCRPLFLYHPSPFSIQRPVWSRSLYCFGIGARSLSTAAAAE